MKDVDINKIYDEEFMTVYKYLICLTHNKETAEDLTQETFYKAIINIKKFRGDCKMSTWLCQIAKNLWIDELKKKKINIVDVDFAELQYQYSVEGDVENKEKIKLLNEKLAKFSDDIKKLFYLKICGNMTFKEIASIMKKSEVWLRVNFYRVREKLKEVSKDE